MEFVKLSVTAVFLSWKQNEKDILHCLHIS